MSSLSALEKLVGELEANPQKLHAPELGFFKAYLTRLGAKIPAKEEKKKEHSHGHHESSHLSLIHISEPTRPY